MKKSEVRQMIKEEILRLKEETEYYFDLTKDNTEKYIAKDNKGSLYIGTIGMKKGKSFLKFKLVLARFYSVFDVRLNKGKIKKVSSKDLEKDVTMPVDFEKLYKR